jgi:putative oxidoreductase
VFVVLIGAIELGGGLLLIAGVLTRPAALMLAGDMVGAIVVSGVAKGELISLTLAPVELVAMLVLLWTGPGAHSVSPSPPVGQANHRLAELMR